jgi:hypothetical protein
MRGCSRVRIPTIHILIMPQLHRRLTPPTEPRLTMSELTDLICRGQSPDNPSSADFVPSTLYFNDLYSPLSFPNLACLHRVLYLLMALSPTLSDSI